MPRAAAVLAVLILTVSPLFATTPPKPRDKVIYPPKHEDPVLAEMEKAREERAKQEEAATEEVRDRQKARDAADKKQRTTLRFDMSTIAKPTSPADFKPAWHLPPVAQYNTGTCWSFSTTSFYESEIHRLSGRTIKLSEIYTVYWEYVEKVRRFVRERGDSLIAEGSESNAVPRIWKQYGIVPEQAYPGVLTPDGRHDHERLIGRLEALTGWVKEQELWDEEVVVAMARALLDRELGAPPPQVTWEGRVYTPKEFLRDVVRLDLDAYVEIMSTLSVPFYTQGEYKVLDNWWHDASYYNVPLAEWFAGFKRAVAQGATVAIGGDVSEPGLNGFEDAAVIPTFDIPSEYIDQDSREFRIDNQTSDDDHGLHLVGMTRTRDGHEWCLIKDSARSSRWGKFEGYYFYRDDFVALKMLTYTVHRDFVADLLAKFKAPAATPAAPPK